MAAEMLADAGMPVVIADAKPSPARKFLMAGKSGLNLTMDQPDDVFARAYSGGFDMTAALAEFGPRDVITWAQSLDREVFTGTSGRVFPKEMKASPLLRAWLGRLAEKGVELRTRWRWTGWDGDRAVFDTADGVQDFDASVVVLACGGASWARLGSDGAWAKWLGADVAPFRPANMGFTVNWSAPMARHFGAPVKPVRLMAGDQSVLGEFVVSERGLEGSGIYAVSSAMRDGANLSLDLVPNLSLDEIRARLARPRGKNSLSNHMRKSLKLSAVKIGLLNEWARPLNVETLPEVIKNLGVAHTGPRPLDEAISIAGGVAQTALTETLMLAKMPGVFCAGEMLDWEAPTGGYLITGCLASGRLAGINAAKWARSAEHREATPNP